jgi:hypothetical protein
MKTFEDQWERLRKKGKLKYIIIHGVLLWGAPMAVIINLYFHYRVGYPWLPTAYYITPIFLIGGFLFGLFMWTFLENRYQRLK